MALAGAPSRTCDGALAGVSGGNGPDAVGRVRDLIAAVLDQDGVSASHVWHVGHQVGPVVVVPDVGLLGLPLRVLSDYTELIPGSNLSIEGQWESTHSQ